MKYHPTQFSFSSYREHGCMQVEKAIPLPLSMALYQLTNGIMCPECPKNEHCGAQDSLHRIEKAADLQVKLHAPPAETVRDEAARRSLSIKKIRRERREKANE